MKPKKSLGQNFLKSVPALNKIVEAGEISKDDMILEIGPGKGALTEKLLERSNRVIAVEKDRGLFEFLKEKFEKEISSGQLKLINGDILDFKIEQNVLEGTLGRSVGDEQRKFLAENFRGESENILRNLKYKIIANIPYNITGAILKKFLSARNQPEMMVLMVQKEVAERIIAKDPRHDEASNKESLLSISVKAYGEPKMIMKVPARYFSPAPKVDSAVISIKNISHGLFQKNNLNEREFWDIIHAGFAHKRKKLASNLKKYLSKTKSSELENKRAEELSISEWIDIVKSLNINSKK